MRSRVSRLAIAVSVTVVTTAHVLAQWHGYPTPGIPRTADGKPNLTAPAPRTPDGKPDLTGIWMAPRIRVDLSQGLKAGESIPFTPDALAFALPRRAKRDPPA